MPPVPHEQPPSLQGGDGPSKSNQILFDVSKNELYRINDNYKTLQVNFVEILRFSHKN